MMGDGGVKQMLAKPIQLADQVTKWADDVHYFRQECAEVKTKTERLASLLRQAARADLYERPARRIMVDTEQVRKFFCFLFRLLESQGRRSKFLELFLFSFLFSLPIV